MSVRPIRPRTYRTYPARLPWSSDTVVTPVISRSGHFKSIASAHTSSISPPISVSRWIFVIAMLLVYYHLEQRASPCEPVYAEGLLVPYPPQLARMSIGSCRLPLALPCLRTMSVLYIVQDLNI